MKKRGGQTEEKSLLKTKKDRLVAFGFVLVVLVAVAILWGIFIVRTQHSADNFVQKYQPIDQSKYRAKK